MHGAQEAVRWKDSTGDHVVILSATPFVKNKDWANDDGYYNASLFAWHYIIQKDSAVLKWKVQDFVKECPLDITVHFVPNTFKITDLDKDHIPEIWIMYSMACRGDLSAAVLKVICYKGPIKMAMRGTTRVQISEKDFTGGQYNFDESFKNSPSEFKKFAENLWKNNVMEKFQ